MRDQAAARPPGVFLSPRGSLGGACALVQAAEALGYESAWTTHGVGRDAFVVLAAYACATRRIALGTGVVPIYPRHPVAMAQEALTLAELSGGRLRLGVGVSHRPMMTDALGLDMGRPLEVVREYVTVLRAALGGRAHHAGPRYRVAWEAAFPAPAPPVLLAGLAAPMVELAAEIGDGVVLWLCSPAYLDAVVRPAVARGRARAGRSPEGFEIVAAVPCAVTPDVAGVTMMFREELARYLALPYYRTMLRASGFAEAVAAFDAAGRRPAAVADVLVDALGAIGDRASARALVEAYRRAGATLAAVRPIGPPEAPHVRATLEALAP
jgi:alkanesulfonate monooxygenase SsuD/methylene tetrahydromethanopterin reductase-like flavin-dependent oxidoreductase (luciferase family)